MIDLTDWNYGRDYPHDKWIKVLLYAGNNDPNADGADHYVEGIARYSAGSLTTPGSWTLAPEQHLWGPIVGWRELKDGERP